VTIIVDANLLLLWIVGLASPDYIHRHKRLQAYTNEDFLILVNILSRARRIILTPNTLTETSNLAGYIAEPARTEIFYILFALIKAAETEERFIESEAAAAWPEFVRLGLTDSALLQLAGDSHTLLTADVNLYLAALHRGLNAENFNHYRNL
jgi:predicted nucleic acid-binding protein